MAQNVTMVGQTREEKGTLLEAAGVRYNLKEHCLNYSEKSYMSSNGAVVQAHDVKKNNTASRP